MTRILFVLLLLIGLAVIARGSGRTGILIGVGIVSLVVGALVWRTLEPPPAGTPRDAAHAERPLETRSRGYTSSDACRACHPAEYESWRHSYHRSMTQVVTPETMLADWDGTEFTVRGRTYRLEQEGDQYWVDMDDLEFSPERRFDGRPVENARAKTRTRRRAVQSTGSHHQQIYWFSSGRGRELYLLPFTWLVTEQRWVPYEATLLWKPDPFQTTEEWNKTCVPCHATAGQPRPVQFTKDLDTHVAELGIACESCHGPGEAHVRHYRSPLERYAAYAEGDGDGDESAADHRIANPASMSTLASTQVCGQCHSHNAPASRAEAKRASTTGPSYRPGDELVETREIHTRPAPEELESSVQKYVADSKTWPDGVVRTAGRDYHGVLGSPCFASGEFGCLTCHSMHAYEDRDDQLGPGMRTNLACTQCHGQFEDDKTLEAHTHHAADSAGSRCYDCHMPHSSYALLKAVRTHRIDSPDVAESIEHGRPNACNLCHLDETLEWTGRLLERWYGTTPSQPDGYIFSERAAAADWLLAGDAAQRGLIAATMARPEPQANSGTTWMAPLVAQLLDDTEYPALALIAQHTITSLPAFEDVDVTSPDARERVLERWRALGGDAARATRVFQTPDGELDSEAISAAYDRRDRRHVNIAE